MLLWGLVRHVVTAAVFRVRRAAELCSWAGVALGALAVSRDRPAAARSVVVSWRFVLRGDACAVAGDKPWAGAALVRVLAVLDVVAA